MISGQKAGLGATILRLLLGVAAGGYSIAVRLRNFLYSNGWLKAHRADAVVISIGNITVGGTGKTPLVIWLCKQIISDSKFQISNSQCGILTRGYKAAKDSRHKTQDSRRKTQEARLKRQDTRGKTQVYRDEPAILAENCPEVKVIVNPDRVAGAAEAINKFGAKVLIMDDGFQHRRLVRDLDIITIDGTQPFGYGKMLPAGLLREPIASLKRADAVVITRCDQVTKAELSEIEKKLSIINPDMIIARSIHTPAYVKTTDNKEISLDYLKGKKIFAFCGIGNPDAFLNTIKTTGCELVGSKFYNDHHHYTNDCLADIYEQAGVLKADLILTTQKDWTKIISDFRFQISDFESSRPFAYIGIEIKFLAGEDKLRDLIEKTLAGKIHQK
ncbi:MAG: tetraacyldisaccharide 4'-kinase [Phycisphaerae bacterium]